MLLPDAKPKRRAKGMIKPSVADEDGMRAAGSQRAIVVIMHRKTMRIMVLNLPILSARSPGAHLPKKEPALRIERSW